MADNFNRISPSGVLAFRQHSASVPPAATDDLGNGYPLFSIWVDEVADTVYISVDDTDNMAVWVNLGSAGAGGYNQIQDEGAPLPQQTTLNFVGPSVIVTDVAGVTTATFSAPSALQMEHANSIKLGGASADVASPLELAVPGTYWLGERGTPPQVPGLKSDGALWVADTALELYGMATVQTAGVGAVARTYQAFLNDVAIPAAVQTRTPASAGFVRIADFAPVAIAAGDNIIASLTLLPGDTVRNPSLFLYVRMP